MDDVAAIRDLIETWAIARDTLDWGRFRTIWHHEGFMVTSSWRPVRGLHRRQRRALRPRHARRPLRGCAIQLAGDRAIAQTRVTISERCEVDGVACDVTVIGRFYDFLERRIGRWGLVLRQPVYERDRLDGRR